MFNLGLKKSALAIHEDAVEKYNANHKELVDACELLYGKREQALYTLEEIESVINSIANTPKELTTQIGEIHSAVISFRKTKEYAQEAIKGAISSGGGMASGVAAGAAVATMAPTAALSIATTFGTASTGTAISALSGAAAQKAALAWIGRGVTHLTGGVVQGAGMLQGQAFLALAGPIGWGVSAAATGVSLISMSNKNKKISEEAVEEAKKIHTAGWELKNTAARVHELYDETTALLAELTKQKASMYKYKNMDYSTLDDDVKLYFGALVNNSLTLAHLVNKTLE